jgi:hypothetical protein
MLSPSKIRFLSLLSHNSLFVPTLVLSFDFKVLKANDRQVLNVWYHPCWTFGFCCHRVC